MATHSIRTYSLFRRGALVLHVVVPALMFVGGVVFGVMVAPKEPPAGAFVVFWLAMVGWMLRRGLMLPHTIEWKEDGTLAFRSFVTVTSTHVSEVVSIQPEKNQIGFLAIRTSNRKIVLLDQFDNFFEFLWLLKKENPSVTLRGC